MVGYEEESINPEIMKQLAEKFGLFLGIAWDIIFNHIKKSKMIKMEAKKDQDSSCIG